MVDMGYIEATDKIVLAGQRLSVEMEIQTVDDMYPGKLVKGGTTDNEVVVGTDGAVAYGWLGYEDTPVMYRPANINTIYVVNDRAAIVSGPIVLRAKLGVSQTIIMGDKLTGTTVGELKKWTPIPIGDAVAAAEEFPVAIAMESVTTDGTTHSSIIVRSLI